MIGVVWVNTAGVTSGAGTVKLFILSRIDVTQYLVFNIVFCRSLFCTCVLFILTIVLSVLRFTASDYPFGIFKLDNYVVCPSSIYCFWLLLWYLQAWQLCCLSFFDLLLLITPLVSSSFSWTPRWKETSE